ncbi:MAG TPA: hypothetical protein VNO70_03555 [Blastocatellia bacterium]|nr:hypothetical protein [Blastocatellia bacterium]
MFFRNRKGAVAGYKELRLAPGLITPEAFRGMRPETVRGIFEWMPRTFGSGLHPVYHVSKDDACAVW